MNRVEINEHVIICPKKPSIPFGIMNRHMS